MSDRDREHAVARELVSSCAHETPGTVGHPVVVGPGLQRIPGPWPSAGQRPRRFPQILERTLDILGSHDVLDHVLYVDLDQEFPYFSPFQDELNALAKKPATARSVEAAMEEAGQFEQGLTRLAWKPAQMEFVRKLFSGMLPHFQSRYPRLRFTYSLTSFFKEVRAMGLQLFDVLELHLWIHSPRFDGRTGFGSSPKTGANTITRITPGALPRRSTRSDRCW